MNMIDRSKLDRDQHSAKSDREALDRYQNVHGPAAFDDDPYLVECAQVCIKQDHNEEDSR